MKTHIHTNTSYTGRPEFGLSHRAEKRHFSYLIMRYLEIELYSQFPLRILIFSYDSYIKALRSCCTPVSSIFLTSNYKQPLLSPVFCSFFAVSCAASRALQLPQACRLDFFFFSLKNLPFEVGRRGYGKKRVTAFIFPSVWSYRILWLLFVRVESPPVCVLI